MGIWPDSNKNGAQNINREFLPPLENDHSYQVEGLKNPKFQKKNIFQTVREGGGFVCNQT